MKNKYLKYLAYGFIVLTIGYFGYKWDQSRKLDEHYLDQLKLVKTRMIHGSAVDSPKELNEYQDQIELCMHLDGYNGIEIMNIRTKAFQTAMQE